MKSMYGIFHLKVRYGEVDAESGEVISLHCYNYDNTAK